MSISLEEVRHVARLARLKLTADEEARFAPQLANIIDYLGMLQELNTDNVPTTSQVTGLTNVTRADIISCAPRQDELLACSPLPKEDHQLLVPSVFS
ncbi:MAG: hypothetical protein A2V81_02335 [Candidatus Abawacabacteria bacterium RBG_16_42_10]|uniref:Aspartyl/glutamyl-tRNA(Asn/Gln) amidotransferase subunit C n=1 Tax=Candidatus Abawacabacteria bacterium RBG_16_42_10 TaxID=1817814 RepID=A0A1F4XKY6_9BACT|nr:MAG: hypothetical protein A2V81_02335 [Candidatus Abawacabacteria bacterium RBG_16_42_10]